MICRFVVIVRVYKGIIPIFLRKLQKKKTVKKRSFKKLKIKYKTKADTQGTPFSGPLSPPATHAGFRTGRRVSI